QAAAVARVLHGRVPADQLCVALSDAASGAAVDGSPARAAVDGVHSAVHPVQRGAVAVARVLHVPGGAALDPRPGQHRGPVLGRRPGGVLAHAPGGRKAPPQAPPGHPRRRPRQRDPARGAHGSRLYLAARTHVPLFLLQDARGPPRHLRL
ncbi:hypothetical protein IWQ57_003761, partial [Coemansia nantahalensis]